MGYLAYSRQIKETPYFLVYKRITWNVISAFNERSLRNTTSLLLRDKYQSERGRLTVDDIVQQDKKGKVFEFRLHLNNSRVTETL